jgi:AcrB/AcrD/AcrF family
LEAALKGSREIGFTVLSISLSLVAVFIPLFLMGGIIGRLFREFAVTVTASIAVSVLVSLSLAPMLCRSPSSNHALRVLGHDRVDDRHGDPNPQGVLSDPGYRLITAVSEAAQDVSPERMFGLQLEIGKVLLADPDVESYASQTGNNDNPCVGDPNFATLRGGLWETTGRDRI